MKMESLTNNLYRILISCLILIIVFSCEDFVDIDPPQTGLVSETVFADDINAESAISGIYSRMVESSATIFTGTQSITVLTSRASDEFLNHSVIPQFIEFSSNDLVVDNGFNSGLWNQLYQFIYSANSVIEGLENSNSVTDSLSTQWQGEARFLRAWCYFYLVNLYGDVPLALTTNFEINATLPRTSSEVVYDQIAVDLLDAQEQLGENYPSDQKIRPNKAVATALLARVNLYRENWAESEREATTLIEDGRYSLESDLENVFLTSSNEAIWQLQTITPGLGSWEVVAFILTRTPRNISLNPEFVTTFEDSDIREDVWVGTLNSGANTFFYPFKYKSRLADVSNEYLTVFRLAEMYLIRAEARARQNNVSGAQDDINTIRTRAQLPATTASDQPTLLSAIELERKHELFAELGHRWFDLKRTQRATEILSPIKPLWEATDALWPIPLGEFLSNPNLGEQNPGY